VQESAQPDFIPDSVYSPIKVGSGVSVFGHIQHPEREDHVCGNVHFESDIRLLLSEARLLAILSLLDGRLIDVIQRSGTHLQGVTMNH
jgi:hypothetical protein